VAHSYGAGPAAEYVLRQNPEVKKFIILDGVLNVDEQKVPSASVATKIIQVNAIRTPIVGLLAHSHTFVQSRFKNFVYVRDNITPDLINTYMQSFNTESTTKRLSAWLLDYTNDPLSYASTKSESYKKLTIPVRLIWGHEDTVTPISLTDVLLESIPDVSLHTLKNVGHIPMIENYDASDGALLEALSK
jgi:pimeloyl-ACP methyl ester carboxylesterase